MKILLLRTWSVNIGNNFIEKGALICIRKAFPGAEIFEISSYPYLINERKHTDMFIGIADLWDLTYFDLVVMAGCILDEENLRRFKSIFGKLKEKDIPLVFLGAGGENYKKENLKYVKSTLNDIAKKFLITRDSNAFDSYADDFILSFEGIDCGFFINEWYDPPKLEESLIAATFDKTKEPKIQTDKKIVHLNHNPFHLGFPFRGLLPAKEILRVFIPKNKKRVNYFVSDLLKDYLFIYANASITYSDRVHACVVTLAYGNKAQFMYKTPRASLFERILDEDISKNPTKVSKERLMIEKKKQIEHLKEIKKYLRL